MLKSTQLLLTSVLEMILSDSSTETIYAITDIVNVYNEKINGNDYLSMLSECVERRH